MRLEASLESIMTSRYERLIFGAHALTRQGRADDYSTDLLNSPIADSEVQKLGGREIAMVTEAFQVHLATVSPAGWPYVQYRSGPRGFIRHLGDQTIAFADHQGNRQFASVGNIESNGKVALFIADMPLRKRLKLLGTARVIDASTEPELLERLSRLDDGARIAARGERSIVIEVEAFDWNCSRSLIPQYTEDQVKQRITPLVDEIHQLRAQVEQLERGAIQ